MVLGNGVTARQIESLSVSLITHTLTQTDRQTVLPLYHLGMH